MEIRIPIATDTIKSLLNFNSYSPGTEAFQPRYWAKCSDTGIEQAYYQVSPEVHQARK